MDLPDDSVQLLAGSAAVLRSFDACVLPVSPQNLAWARTALAAAAGVLRTPVLVLARDLKAAAVDDLYESGVCDFVRAPMCLEELRVRLERIVSLNRYSVTPLGRSLQVTEGASNYSTVKKANTSLLDQPGLVSTEAFCETILERSGAEIEAFAVASATRCSTGKESFHSAKGKLIERFERAYLKASLGRHEGNIAMAARSAQKHRRAFWALIKKHQIDPNFYRQGYYPKHPQDG
ncbi:MAG: hypothetical protein KA735_15095 [Burkholderiaceae bacterium]|nr:hypothetical protein [Burkholderiaceae bacterium]